MSIVFIPCTVYNYRHNEGGTTPQTKGIKKNENKKRKKISGIRTAIQDMKNNSDCGWIAFDEETGEVFFTSNPNCTTPTLKYVVKNEKELKHFLMRQFGCID